MSPLNMPAPIAAYFAADRDGAEVLAQCFTATAVVQDEGRTHTGRDAIQQWKAAASTAYQYTVEPTAVDQHGIALVVCSRVSGNFPGSPVDLRYRFELEGGLIASLEISP